MLNQKEAFEKRLETLSTWALYNETHLYALYKLNSRNSRISDQLSLRIEYLFLKCKSNNSDYQAERLDNVVLQGSSVDFLPILDFNFSQEILDWCSAFHLPLLNKFNDTHAIEKKAFLLQLLVMFEHKLQVDYPSDFHVKMQREQRDPRKRDPRASDSNMDLLNTQEVATPDQLNPSKLIPDLFRLYNIQNHKQHYLDKIQREKHDTSMNALQKAENFKRYQERLDGYQIEYDRLSKKSRDLFSQFSTVDSALVDKIVHDSIEKHTKNNHSKLDLLDSRYSELSKKYSLLQSSNEDANAEIILLKKSIESMTGENTRLQKMVSGLTVFAESLDGKVTEMKKKHFEECIEFQERISELEKMKGPMMILHKESKKRKF